MGYRVSLPILLLLSIVSVVALPVGAVTAKMARYQVAALYVKQNSAHLHGPYLKIEKIWVRDNVVYAALDEQQSFVSIGVAYQHTPRKDIWVWTGKKWRLKSIQRGPSMTIYH